MLAVEGVDGGEIDEPAGLPAYSQCMAMPHEQLFFANLYKN